MSLIAHHSFKVSPLFISLRAMVLHIYQPFDAFSGLYNLSSTTSSPSLSSIRADKARKRARTSCPLASRLLLQDILARSPWLLHGPWGIDRPVIVYPISNSHSRPGGDTWKHLDGGASLRSRIPYPVLVVLDQKSANLLPLYIPSQTGSEEDIYIFISHSSWQKDINLT